MRKRTILALLVGLVVFGSLYAMASRLEEARQYLGDERIVFDYQYRGGGRLHSESPAVPWALIYC